MPGPDPLRGDRAGVFDTVLVADWSARAAPSSARPQKDSIWIAIARNGTVETTYLRTRAAARRWLFETLHGEKRAGRRVLAGFDFPLGYPLGFAEGLAGRASAFAVWDWLAAHVEDGEDNANNRFALAAEINARFTGIGPFWGCPAGCHLQGLPQRGSLRTSTLPERRQVERAVPRAQSVWKLFTTGSVGSQTLLGLPVLAALRREFGEALTVWPFEPVTAPIVLAEIYPGLIEADVQSVLAITPGAIKDDVQVRLLARALAEADLAARLADVPDWPGRAEEGWILAPEPFAQVGRARPRSQEKST